MKNLTANPLLSWNMGCHEIFKVEGRVYEKRVKVTKA